MNIGENIKRYRKEKKLTQQQLADQINKSTITVRKYEANDTLPPIDVLGDIATVLQVPVDFLLGSRLIPMQEKGEFCGFIDSQLGYFDPSQEDYLEFIQRKTKDIESSNKYNKIAIPNGFVSKPNIVTPGLAYESLVNLIIYINKKESLFDMDDKTYRYLLMKVCDLLEFELFKLNKEGEQNGE